MTRTLTTFPATTSDAHMAIKEEANARDPALGRWARSTTPVAVFCTSTRRSAFFAVAPSQFNVLQPNIPTLVSAQSAPLLGPSPRRRLRPTNPTEEPSTKRLFPAIPASPSISADAIPRPMLAIPPAPQHLSADEERPKRRYPSLDAFDHYDALSRETTRSCARRRDSCGSASAQFLTTTTDAPSSKDGPSAFLGPLPDYPRSTRRRRRLSRRSLPKTVILYSPIPYAPRWRTEMDKYSPPSSPIPGSPRSSIPTLSPLPESKPVIKVPTPPPAKLQPDFKITHPFLDLNTLVFNGKKWTKPKPSPYPVFGVFVHGPSPHSPSRPYPLHNAPDARRSKMRALLAEMKKARLSQRPRSVSFSSSYEPSSASSSLHSTPVLPARLFGVEAGGLPPCGDPFCPHPHNPPTHNELIAVLHFLVARRNPVLCVKMKAITKIAAPKHPAELVRRPPNAVARYATPFAFGSPTRPTPVLMPSPPKAPAPSSSPSSSSPPRRKSAPAFLAHRPRLLLRLPPASRLRRLAPLDSILPARGGPSASQDTDGEEDMGEQGAGKEDKGGTDDEEQDEGQDAAGLDEDDEVRRPLPRFGLGTIQPAEYLALYHANFNVLLNGTRRDARTTRSNGLANLVRGFDAGGCKDTNAVQKYWTNATTNAFPYDEPISGAALTFKSSTTQLTNQDVGQWYMNAIQDSVRDADSVDAPAPRAASRQRQLASSKPTAVVALAQAGARLPRRATKISPADAKHFYDLYKKVGPQVFVDRQWTPATLTKERQPFFDLLDEITDYPSMRRGFTTHVDANCSVNTAAVLGIAYALDAARAVFSRTSLSASPPIRPKSRKADKKKRRAAARVQANIPRDETDSE
ncbi:hypothetical protein MKEN_01492000 [Mycena kentingensis (nom. inval.)]|nr:hypothetical protein MKEN_01492000 [Mycena kentingensis (nom. inval.)]